MIISLLPTKACLKSYFPGKFTGMIELLTEEWRYCMRNRRVLYRSDLSLASNIKIFIIIREEVLTDTEDEDMSRLL
jgi:hypothetical protein